MWKKNYTDKPQNTRTAGSVAPISSEGEGTAHMALDGLQMMLGTV